MKNGLLAAYPVVVAGDGRQSHDGPVILHPIFVVGQGGAGLVDGHGPVLMDHAAGLHRLAVGHAGDGLQIGLIEAGHVLRKGVKALHVLVDVLPIDPVVLDQDVCHGQSQGPVGASPGPQVDVRQLFHGGGDPGIHDDEFHAPGLGLIRFLSIEIPGMVGVEGPAQVHAAVGHIPLGSPAGGDFPGHKAGGEAGAGLRGVVLRPEGERQAVQPGPKPLGVAAEEEHAVRPLLLLPAVELFRADAVGLLPGDLLEFSLSSLPHPL